MGFGHLGEFFAKELSESHKLEITYRSKLNPSFSHLTNYHFDSNTNELFSFKDEYDFVIWSFTPFDEYPTLLKNADTFFKSATNWIYIGSTGVYGAGKVTEESPLSRSTPRSKRLADIEDVLSGLNRNITIIRPSGLVDEKRNPKTWIKRRKSITNSKNKMNLVHTRDVARFILFVIENGLYNESFNLCMSEHPEKGKLYNSFLAPEELIQVEFDEKQENQKIVFNKKSKSVGFKYLVDTDLNHILKNDIRKRYE